MSRFTGKEIEIEKIISECIENKKKAQHKLFRHYYGKMMNVCMRYASHYEEAQDMLNEGFIKIFQNLNKYNHTGSFEAWMKRVMANAALDFQRKHHTLVKTIPYEDVAESEFELSFENSGMQNLTYEELMQCIQKLPAMSKNVFNLYVFESYSHKEIANMLHIKEGTSHWHLNYARKKLQEEITRLYHK